MNFLTIESSSKKTLLKCFQVHESTLARSMIYNKTITHRKQIELQAKTKTDQQKYTSYSFKMKELILMKIKRAICFDRNSCVIIS